MKTVGGAILTYLREYVRNVVVYSFITVVVVLSCLLLSIMSMSSKLHQACILLFYLTWRGMYIHINRYVISSSSSENDYT